MDRFSASQRALSCSFVRLVGRLSRWLQVRSNIVRLEQLPISDGKLASLLFLRDKTTSCCSIPTTLGRLDNRLLARLR